MMDLMPVYVDHDPAEGVLCWGGPENGRVVRIEATDAFYLFAVERRLAYTSLDLAEPLAPAFGTVRYDVEKFGWTNPAGERETWRVLVYPENKDTQRRQMEVAANFVLWLCIPGLPEPSDDAARPSADSTEGDGHG